MRRCRPSAPGKIISVKRYRRREYLAERLKHLDMDCIAQGNSGTIGCAEIVSMRLFVCQRDVEAKSKPSPKGLLLNENHQSPQDIVAT